MIGKCNVERYKKFFFFMIEGFVCGVDELFYCVFFYRRGEFVVRVRFDNGVDDRFKIVIKYFFYCIIVYVFF